MSGLIMFLAAVASVVLAAVSLRELSQLAGSDSARPGRTAVSAGLVGRPGRPGGAARRRRQQVELPLLAGALARSLRSGATIAQSLGEAGQSPALASFHEDLDQVVQEWSAGGALAEVLDGWAGRSTVAGMELLVAALVLGSQTGGDRAQVLDRVAATMGDRLAVEAEVVALTSQARASAMVVTLAPMGLAVVFLLVDPSVVEVMVGTAVGSVCLGLGVGLAVLNWLWMQRLVAGRLA